METHDPKTDTQAAIDAGMAIAVPQPVNPGEIAVVALPAGGTAVTIDLTADKYLAAPRRKRGTVTVRDAASFNAYWGKHSQVDTELYADLDAFSAVGVINADGDPVAEAGWRDHRLVLDVRSTKQWKAWAAHDGRLLTQVQFAEHIEDRLPDIVQPTGAEMLELAQTFQAKTKVNFESSRILSSSERSLVFTEETTAAAGRKGDITIPATFRLGLVPFEGSDPYSVTARLRYRIADGNLTIGYKLERPEEVQQAAFLDIIGTVEKFTGITAMRGIPAEPVA